MKSENTIFKSKRFKAKKAEKKLKNQGFTLIELMLSLAMIAILAGTTLSINRVSDTERILFLNLNEIVSAIRFAQSNSLAIAVDEQHNDRHICGFGFVADSSTTYKIFYTYATNGQYRNNPDVCNNSNYLGLPASGNQVEYINSFKLKGDGVEFDSGDVGNNNEFVFKVPYGEVYFNGNHSFGSEEIKIKKGGSEKSITINSFGQINVQ